MTDYWDSPSRDWQELVDRHVKGYKIRRYQRRKYLARQRRKK